VNDDVGVINMMNVILWLRWWWWILDVWIYWFNGAI